MPEKKQFSKQDAILRVLDARTGSLSPDQVTIEYLQALKINVQIWLDAISDANTEFFNSGLGE